MNKFEATFYDILLDISNAPDRVVGKKSFSAVASFIEGYSYSLYRNNNIHILNRWQRWIEMKFIFLDTAYNWPRILEHCLGEDDAIQCLPELYLDFINSNIPYIEEKEFEQIYHKVFMDNKDKKNKGIENSKTNLAFEADQEKVYQPSKTTQYDAKKKYKEVRIELGLES